MAITNPVRIVHDAPFHDVAGRNDTVIVLLPDGHRIVLTADAAIRSGGLLMRLRETMPAGEVIPVDFGTRAPLPLGKPDGQGLAQGFATSSAERRAASLASDNAA